MADIGVKLDATLELDNKPFKEGIREASDSVKDLGKTSEKSFKDIAKTIAVVAFKVGSLIVLLEQLGKVMVANGTINKENVGKQAQRYGEWARAVADLYKKYRPMAKAASDFAGTMSGNAGAFKTTELAINRAIKGVGAFGEAIKDVDENTKLFNGTAKEVVSNYDKLSDIEDIEFVMDVSAIENVHSVMEDVIEDVSDLTQVIKASTTPIEDFSTNQKHISNNTADVSEALTEATQAVVLYSGEVEDAGDASEDAADKTEKNKSALVAFAAGAGQATVQAFLFRKAITGIISKIPIVVAALATIAAIYHSIKFAAKSATLYINSSVEMQDKLARTTDGMTAWGLAWKDAGLWLGKFTSSFTLFWGTFKSFISKGALKALGLKEYINQAKQLIELRIKLQRSEQSLLTETQKLSWASEDALRIATDINKTEEERKKAAVEWFKSETSIVNLKKKQLEGELVLNNAIKERSDEIDAEKEAIKRNISALDREQVVLSQGLADYYMLISKIEDDAPLAGSIASANIELDKLRDKLNKVTTEADRIKLRVEVEAKEIQIKAMLNGIPTPTLKVKVEPETTFEQDLSGIEGIDLSGDDITPDFEDWSKDTVVDLNNVISAMNSVASSADGMSVALQGMFDGENVLASFGDFLTNLAALMLQFGTLLTAFGVAEEAFKVGGVGTKIAAGIAMAGIAIKIGSSIAGINSAGSGGNKSSGISGVSGTIGGYSPAQFDYGREIEFTVKGRDLVAVYDVNKNDRRRY